MKVFSKGHKNKSTPALTTLANTTTVSTKPKNMTKLKTFKQILTQNVQITANKMQEEQHSKFHKDNSRPKTERNHHPLKDSTPLNKTTEINSFHTIAPTVKLINSINYKHLRTDDDRSSAESVQKIQSIVYYGKQKDTTKLLNSSCLQQDGKMSNSSSQNINKLNISTRSQNYGHEKIAYRQEEMYRVNKENQSKRINHYKNSKLVNFVKSAIKKQWSMSCFKIGKKIGRGRFGSVFIVQERQTGAIFALKKIDLAQVKEEQMESQIVQEIKLQVFMNYPNIVKLYGFFKEGNDLCLILEYAEGKCLFSKLNQKIQERQASYYTLQMIKALRYCHSQSILHRDLKPENILLSFGVAKLADFGWAAYAPKYKRTTFCGTLDYVPPEIIKGNYYDEKVDIWSLGVLMYEMSAGYAPFETHPNDSSLTEQMTMKRILECDLKVPSNISKDLRLLIESILSTEPDRRPSLQEIQNSPWMQRFKEQGVEISKYIWDFWMKLVDK